MGTNRLFSHEHLDQAQTIRFDQNFFADRKDVPGLTIDPATSRDLDDAIWIEPHHDGYRIHVSIADVGAGIKKGSPLDKEAHERAFTRYKSWGNIPMIPPMLSEDALSLLPNKKSPTITVTIDLDADLNIIATDLAKTAVTPERLNYKQANHRINDASDPLAEWGKLAQRLRDKRRKEGAMIFDNRKAGILYSEDGPRRVETGTYDSHILIEELMVLANHATAQKMAHEGVPYLYRRHQDFAQSAQRERFIQIMQQMVEGKVEVSESNLRAAMQTLPHRARYSPEQGNHAGLNLESYSHFTSPIRRYADLINNRVVSAYIDGVPSPYSHSELASIAEHVNTATDQEKQHKSEGFKAAAKQELDAQIHRASSDQLAALPSQEFTKIVKRAIVTEALQDRIVTAFRVRAERETLTPTDIFQVLLGAGSDSDRREEIKTMALSYLEKRPHDALSALNIARQIHPSFAYRIEEASAVDDRKLPIFAARIAATIDGDEVTVLPLSIAPTKKEAIQQGALKFWQSYAHAQLVAPQEIALGITDELQRHLAQSHAPQAELTASSTIPQKPSASDSRKNPISELNEWLQRHRGIKSEEIAERGQGHTKEFMCVFTITGPSLRKPIRVTGTWCPTKKAAQAAAAQTALAHEAIAGRGSPDNRVLANTAAKISAINPSAVARDPKDSGPAR